MNKAWHSNAAAAERNGSEHGNRFSPLLHDFAFAVRQFAAGKAYDFTLKNLGPALPGGYYATRCALQAADTRLTEGGLLLARLGAARRFFAKLGYTCPIFTTSSDAVFIRPLLTVRDADRALLGLNTLSAVHVGNSYQGIVAKVEQYGMATQADVFLLNPLDSRLPSFPLAVWPQTATAPHQLFAERTSLVHGLLAEHSLFAVLHASDGDASQLATMLVRGNPKGLPEEKLLSFSDIPGFGAKWTLHCPARAADLRQLGVNDGRVPVLHVQARASLVLSFLLLTRGGRILCISASSCARA